MGGPFQSSSKTSGKMEGNYSDRSIAGNREGEGTCSSSSSTRAEMKSSRAETTQPQHLQHSTASSYPKQEMLKQQPQQGQNGQQQLGQQVQSQLQQTRELPPASQDGAQKNAAQNATLPMAFLTNLASGSSNLNLSLWKNQQHCNPDRPNDANLNASTARNAMLGPPTPAVATNELQQERTLRALQDMLGGARTIDALEQQQKQQQQQQQQQRIQPPPPQHQQILQRNSPQNPSSLSQNLRQSEPANTASLSRPTKQQPEMPEKTQFPHHMVIPCRARGMSIEHNLQTARFIVPENIRHGDNLVCTYPACRDRGVKFLFCSYCRAPVAKRNFRKRHSHMGDDESENKTIATSTTVNSTGDAQTSSQILARGGALVSKEAGRPIGRISRRGNEISSSSISQQASEAASLSSSSAGQRPKVQPTGNKRKREESPAETFSSTGTESDLIFQNGNSKPESLARGQLWASLLEKRPRSDQSEQMSEWLMHVMAVSDSGNPLAEMASSTKDYSTALHYSSLKSSSPSPPYSDTPSSNPSSSDPPSSHKHLSNATSSDHTSSDRTSSTSSNPSSSDPPSTNEDESSYRSSCQDGDANNSSSETVGGNASTDSSCARLQPKEFVNSTVQTSSQSSNDSSSESYSDD